MKIIVPEGMLRSFDEAIQLGLGSTPALEVALRWLSENPIVPSDAQVGEMRRTSVDAKFGLMDSPTLARFYIAEWQRRMFLAPEPDVPEAVKDLLWRGKMIRPGDETIEENDRRIIEAYRRGQKAGFP